MHFRGAAVLLLGSLALGQAAPSSPKAPRRTVSPSAAATTARPTSGENPSVAPNSPVITITGICDRPATAAKPVAECKTVVTRAEFERLANALQPNMPANIQRRLADAYPKILLMAHEARKRGLENDPKFKELFQFVKLQVLSQELSRSLKEEADNVPEPEIESYYKANTPNFEQASLQRLFIPKNKQAEPAAADRSEKEEEEAKVAAAQKAGEEAMKKEAAELRGRAAAGEDFDKLQKDAYEAAGFKGSPPTTALGTLTRNQLPVNQRSVVDLAADQVSQLFTEPNGYYVYKVLAKGTKSLNEARDQIRMTLAQERLQATMQRIQNSGKAELNEAYFAPAPPPPTVHAGAAPATGGAPSAPSKQPEAGKKPEESKQPPE